MIICSYNLMTIKKNFTCLEIQISQKNPTKTNIRRTTYDGQNIIWRTVLIWISVSQQRIRTSVLRINEFE